MKLQTSNFKLQRRAKAVVLLAIWLVVALTPESWAGDLTRGYSFSSNEQVTNVKLHSLVDAATINTSLFTGQATATPVGADTLLIYSSGVGGFRKCTASAFLAQTNFSTKFDTLTYAFPDNTSAGGSLIITNHGLPGVPQLVRWVAVCTNADLAYTVGDEVDVINFIESGGPNAQNYFQPGVSSSNVWLRGTALTTALAMRNKTNGSYSAITYLKWNLKGHCVYFN